MIKARILQILERDGVGCYKFQISGTDALIYMLALGDHSHLREGLNVRLNFKSSDVIIATSKLQNCSIRNELPCKILKISKGEILSVIHLKFAQFEFESIISSLSCNELNLNEGDSVFAYVKSTCVHISGIDD